MTDKISFKNSMAIKIKKGVTIEVGPFSVRIRSDIQEVIHGISLLYSDYPILTGKDFSDFHLSILRPLNIRRWIRPQAVFLQDNNSPFKPLPLDHAFALFEWGLNWCISKNAHQYLLIHSAVVEKNGYAAIMPAKPGKGKSTLCAGLVARGWRLLSDELALISPESGLITPIPRPISLKNRSIDIIRAFAKKEAFGKRAEDTAKGTIIHMKPPRKSIERADEKGVPFWIISPEFIKGSDAKLSPYPKARAFMHLIGNSFNYNVLGLEGFRTASHLIDRCDCLSFQYEKIEDAVNIFEEMLNDKRKYK